METWATIRNRSAGRIAAGASVVFIASSWWALAAENPALDSAVRRLGSEAFSERHEAGDELMQAGEEAVPFLREAAESHPSPEVRYRAAELLQQIERQLLDRRLAEIVSGKDVANDFLPWERFQMTVGDDRAARVLFAQTLKAAPELILAVGTDTLQTEFERSMSDWLNPSLRRNGQLSVYEVTALLFAMIQPECRPGPYDAGIISQFALTSALQTEVAGAERGPALRALLSGWVIRREAGPPLYRLQLASRFGLTEGLIPAREIISAAPQSQDPQIALSFIAQHGDLEDVPAVEGLLESKQQLTASHRSSGAFTMEVRDVAVVTLWKLIGEDPSKHGVAGYREANGRAAPGAIGFNDEVSREAAIQAWKTWRKRHVKQNLPADGRAAEGFDA